MATTVASPVVNFGATAFLSSGTTPAPSTCNVNQNESATLTVGSAAFNVGLVYSEAFTVTSGTPITWDLTTLTDPLGNAVNFSTVTDIVIKNLSVTSGQDMTLGGSTTNTIMTACPFVFHAQSQLSGASLRGLELAVSGSTKVLELTVAAGTSVAGQITIFGR